MSTSVPPSDLATNVAPFKPVDPLLPDELRGLIAEYALDMLDADELDPQTAFGRLIGAHAPDVMVGSYDAGRLVDRRSVRLLGAFSDPDSVLECVAGRQRVHIDHLDRFSKQQLRLLATARSVRIDSCAGLRDADLVFLEGVEDVYLGGAHSLTDRGVFHLRNCRRVALSNCRLLTQACLVHLKNAEQVELLWWAARLDAHGLAHLGSVARVVFVVCFMVDELALETLQNAEEVELRHCSQVGVRGVELLGKGPLVRLGGQMGLTPDDALRLAGDGYKIVWT